MDPRFPTGKFVFDQAGAAARRRDCIAAISSFPGELKASMAGARLDQPYRDGGWTARQVVHHVADSHMNAYIRLKLALTEENPTIKPYDEAAWAELEDTKRVPPEVSLRLLEDIHARWSALLHGLTERDFARTLVHPERGPLTVDHLLAIYAWHGPHHTAHVTRLKERSGW